MRVQGGALHNGAFLFAVGDDVLGVPFFCAYAVKRISGFVNLYHFTLATGTISKASKEILDVSVVLMIT